MEQLANHRCVHRDLAARNVLLATGMVCKVGRRPHAVLSAPWCVTLRTRRCCVLEVHRQVGAGRRKQAHTLTHSRKHPVFIFS